jgi:hypothetical protein
VTVLTRRIGGVQLEIIAADITTLGVDATVNAADTLLLGGAAWTARSASLLAPTPLPTAPRSPVVFCCFSETSAALRTDVLARYSGPCA